MLTHENALQRAKIAHQPTRESKGVKMDCCIKLSRSINYPAIMENQMEKKMEPEMEMRINIVMYRDQSKK